MSGSPPKLTKFTVDVFSTILTKIFLAVVKLGSSVVTARFLGAAGRGEFFSITQLAGVVNTFGTLSVGEGLIYFLSTKKLKKEHSLATVLIFIFLFTIPIWAVIFILFFLTDFLFPGDKNVEVLSIVLAIIPLFLCEYLFSSVLKGVKLFQLANKISIFCRTLLLVMVIFGVFFSDHSIIEFMYFFVFGYSLVAFTYFLTILFQFAPPALPPLTPLIGIVTYSIRVHPMIFISEIEYRADIFILLYFLDFRALGVYSIGLSFGQLVWYVSNSINNVAFPSLAEVSNPRDKIEFLHKVVRYNLIINAGIIILMLLSGYWLITIIFGEQFKGAFYVFCILSLGLIFDSISRNLVVWFKSVDNAKPITLSIILALMLNVVLNFLLIPDFGILGAASASAISYLLRSIMMMYFYSKFNTTKFMKTFLPQNDDFSRLAKIAWKLIQMRRSAS